MVFHDGFLSPYGIISPPFGGEMFTQSACRGSNYDQQFAREHSDTIAPYPCRNQ